MLIFVIYDISDNKSRSNLIKKLQHFGLHRIQKSAFSGTLNLKSRNELAENLDSYLSCKRDSIILIPICKNCSNSIKIFNQGELLLPKKEEFKIFT